MTRRSLWSRNARAASFAFMGDVMIIDRREMKNHLATRITLLTKQLAVAEIKAA